jgi:hypothetical protein
MTKQLPPDPDNKNDERADWANKSIGLFMIVTGTDYEDALADLLCDMMHWADRGRDQDFEVALGRARGMYEEETREDCSTCGEDHEGSVPLTCENGDGV